MKHFSLNMLFFQIKKVCHFLNVIRFNVGLIGSLDDALTIAMPNFLKDNDFVE